MRGTLTAWLCAALLAHGAGTAAAASTYGPLGEDEALSRIALQVRPARTRVGTWQTVLALYRANPGAFEAGDIHRPRPGAVLRVPTAAEVFAVDPEFAMEFARHPEMDLSGFVAGAGVAGAAGGAGQAGAPAPSPARPPAEGGPAAATLSPPARPPAAGSPAAATATRPARPAAAGDAGKRLALAQTMPVPPRRRPIALQMSPFKFTAEVAQAERRRPGDDPAPAPVAPAPDLNRTTALRPVAPPPQPWDPQTWEKAPVPDRWRLLNDLALTTQRWYDPYNQNTWKGDKPVRNGDEFISLSAIWDSTLEPRRLPTPVSPASSSGAGADSIFGEPDQFLYNQNLILSVIYLKGDTTFRPPDYEVRFTPVLNYNYTQAEERRLLHIDARDGVTRKDTHIGVQELFADLHLRNVSERFDFDSVRLGIQPFSSDFRGFLFQDNQLMARLFGTRANNRFQYNLAWMRRLEKDTNSGLNDLGAPLRNDDTWFANVFWQDFPTLGFVSQGIVAHNRNREQEHFFDDNGFLARPASLGVEKPRSYEVTYVGYNGDGHFGRLNATVSLYGVAGRQSRGVFIDAPRDIAAAFAAAELSYDQDWVRWRASGLWASGDDDPFDDSANGFDAIFENPIFAGADTSFWTRQAVPLIGGGGVTLSTRNGMLNNLRTSKEHGQSNFDNPGIALAGLGADFDLLPELRVSTNANHLWFADTAVLEAARQQAGVDAEIGWDLSTAVIWRPFFTQNIVLRLSGAVLVPGPGFKDLFPDQEAYSVLGNFIFTY